MTFFKDFAFILFVWWILIVLHIKDTRANYGDNCTQTDPSNCTSPQEVCSNTGTCCCSNGYITEDIDVNYNICRKPSYEEKCEPKIGCDETLQCVNISGSLVCQCDTVEYFNPRGRVCVSLTDLEVGIYSTITTATTVELQWDGNSPDSGVEYNVQWTPSDGRIDYIYFMGMEVSHLQPGTEYNFTIVTSIPEGKYSSFVGPNITVCTKVLYGGKCDKCSECLDNTTTCITAMDGMLHCLCGSMLYNSTQTGNCTSLPTYNESCDITIGCQDSLQCANISGSMICQCYIFSEYFDPGTGHCLSKPSMGEKCNVSIGCEDYSKCVGTPPTCQCTSTDVYFDDINSMCLQLSDLQVVVSSVAATDTTVTFSWEESSPESGVEYSLHWIPNDGHLEYTYPEGGEVSGLQSGTQYNFTIVSTLSGGSTRQKQYFGPNITICTKVLYAGECRTTDDCFDNTTFCDDDTHDTVSRCLCLESFFNSTPTGNCTSMNEVIVTNLSNITTDSTIFLYWNASTKWGSIVTYDLDMFPDEGHVDSINSSGCVVSGLAPETAYSFFINSIVPGDGYNDKRFASPPEFTVMTKIYYLGVCDSNPIKAECLETVCRMANDGTMLCMCDVGYYKDVMGICTSSETLQVSNASVAVKATNAILTWTEKQDRPYSLRYRINWAPSDGRLDFLNNTNAHISDLIPGASYNFSIVSVLPPDENYPELSSSVQVTAVLPKPAFNEACNVTIGCHGSQHCVNVSGSMVCQCDSSSEYYDTISDQCLSRPSLNQACNTSIGCIEFFQCVGTPPTCKCDATDVYFDSIYYQCLPVKDLGVTLISTAVTASSVTFNWTPTNSEAEYDLLWTPHIGQIDYTNDESGQVSGLQPGSQYNFTVVSGLIGDSTKKYFGPNITVCTQALYGGQCNTCGSCQNNATACIKAKDSRFRCLCRNSLYNKTQNGNCSSLNDLAVSDISSTSTTSTIKFTWTVITHLSSVMYKITWHPGGGQVDSVSSTGGSVSGLSPGVLYNFTIITMLAGDTYNYEKNVTSPDYLAKTQILYLEECTPYTNEECQFKTPCVQDKESNFRCMCDTNSFFNDKMENCSNLESLKVSHLSVTVTSTTATITWTTHEHPSLVTYTLDWVPVGGTLDSINSTSAYVSGLTSGTLYNFTVVSLLDSDIFYPEKRALAQASPVMTKTQGESSGNKVGVGVGVGVSCAVLIVILIVGIFVFKRRTPSATRLQEFHEQEYVAGEVQYESYEGEKSSSMHSSQPGSKTTVKPKDISLKNLPHSSHTVHDDGDNRQIEDSFDSRDVLHLL